MKHFTPSQNQYIARLIKKAKAKERARIIMNHFTPGQRSEIARLIKKAEEKGWNRGANWVADSFLGDDEYDFGCGYNDCDRNNDEAIDKLLTNLKDKTL